MNSPVASVPGSSVIKRQFDALRRPHNIHRATEIIAPIGVGLALGAVLLLARGLPSRWAGLVILATIAPTVALLVNDMRKLLLVTIVVDISLGLDISLAQRAGHSGGPPGFTISLMTMALVVGYASWLTNRPIDSKRKVSFHKDMTIPALVYLFFMLMSVFQATEVWFSITQLFLEVQFLLMYFYVIDRLRTWANARLVFATLVISLLVQSVVMLLQYFGGFQLSALGIETRASGSNIASAASRVGGTLGSPTGVATYVAASLAITFAAYLVGNRLVDRKLALSALLLGTVALVTTQSRSAWIAFAVAMLILTVIAMKRRLSVKALLALLIIVLVLGVGFSRQIVDRLTKSEETSALTRVWHTELAFNILNDHMFTGVGLSNSWFVIRSGDYLPLEMLGKKVNILHNKYLTIWVETGLFGFLAFVWLLLAATRHALQALIRTKNNYASIAITGLLSALAVYLVHMASDPFGGRARMQFLWLIFALIAASSQISKTEELEDPSVLSEKPAKTEQVSLGLGSLDSSYLLGRKP